LIALFRRLRPCLTCCEGLSIQTDASVEARLRRASTLRRADKRMSMVRSDVKTSQAPAYHCARSERASRPCRQCAPGDTLHPKVAVSGVPVVGWTVSMDCKTKISPSRVAGHPWDFDRPNVITAARVSLRSLLAARCARGPQPRARDGIPSRCTPVASSPHAARPAPHDGPARRLAALMPVFHTVSWLLAGVPPGCIHLVVVPGCLCELTATARVTTRTSEGKRTQSFRV
jgi:hypothetical protein